MIVGEKCAEVVGALWINLGDQALWPSPWGLLYIPSFRVLPGPHGCPWRPHPPQGLILPIPRFCCPSTFPVIQNFGKRDRFLPQGFSVSLHVSHNSTSNYGKRECFTIPRFLGCNHVSHISGLLCLHTHASIASNY